MERNDEEKSDSEGESEKRKLSGLEKFISENPELQKMKVNKFSKKLDICLLQIPKEVNPDFSLHQTISLESPTKLKINKQKFVLKPITIEEPMAILTSKLKIIEKIPCLRLEPQIKAHPQDSVVPENEAVTQPLSGSKTRHVAFGPHYKSKINLNEEIQKKLNEALEKARKMPKKKKPKKERQEAIFELLESHKPIKQEKQKGIVNSTMITNSKADFNPELSKIEKKKRKRKNSENAQKEEDDLISTLLESVKCELKQKKHKKKRKISDR